MIKYLALDLDGTLLSSDKTISQVNQVAIRAARGKGVKVILTTGRPLEAIRHYLDLLDLNHANEYSITFNGGLVRSNDGRVIASKGLEYADLAPLVTYMKTQDLPLDIISDQQVFELDARSYYRKHTPFLDFKVADYATMPQELSYQKAIVCYDPEQLDQLLLRLPQAILDQYEVFKTRDILLEFMPKGVDKAYGLERLSHHLGFSREMVMACGDEMNDATMLSWAGWGLAMANSSEQVKPYADLVLSANNDQDGVAQAIQDYILQGER